MANWSVTQGQLTTHNITDFDSGEAEVLNMTISTVVGGVDTQYLIEAANFVIGGTSLETEQGSLLEYVFQQGNMDTGIEKVVFTNNGIIGQPNNTVNVAVHLSTGITSLDGWPSNQNLYIDIDERATLPPSQDGDRVFCFKVYWPYNANQTVEMTDLSASGTQQDLTETITQGSSSIQPISSHQGSVPNNEVTEVAKLTFTATNSNYYLATPSLGFFSLGEYGEYYSSVYTPTIDSATGAIMSFVVQVYYNPPTDGSLYPDPFSEALKMCQLSHAANVRYALKTIQVAETNHISAVAFEDEIRPEGGSGTVTVEGISDTKFVLQVQKNESLTSSQAASSGGFFNFSLNKWVDNPPQNQFVIESNSTAKKIHVNYESTAIDVRYNITLQSFEGSTLAAEVPTVGNPGQVTQYGYNDATINPYSASHTLFNAFPTRVISRKKQAKGGVNYTSRSIFAVGGNGGSSSTKVVLQTPVPQSIAPGQIVTVRNTVNASIIPHNTTVVNLRGTVLTLSAASAIPNTTDIRFDNNDVSLEAFDFTITAGSGRNIAPIADKDMRTIVSGINSRVSKIGGGSSGTTVGFTSGTGPTATADGISVGAKMTGDEVTGDIDSTGVVFTTVTAVNTLNNTITVFHSQVSALTGVDLTFSNSDTFTANDGIELIDAQVSAVDGNNIKLQGYFKVKTLNATGIVALNIDKIITNTAE